MGSRAIRTALSIVVNVILVVTVLLAVRLVALFTAQFATSGWGSAVIKATSFLVIPFGLSVIRTPYGGGFSVNTAVTIVVLLLADWVLSGLRDRA